MALQSKTINGSTNLPTLWSHKIVVTENSTSVANNTSSITVTAYIGVINRTSSYMTGSSISCTIKVTGCSNQVISYSGSPTIYSGKDLNIGSKTFTVPHNNDGNKTVTISSSFTNNVRPESGGSSGNMTLTYIPRYATMTDASNFNDEQNPWFTFSNPANTSMSCWLEINPSGEHLAVRTFSGTSGTYTWALTTEERNQLRAKIPNSNTATCRIGLYSTIGGSTQASYKDKTFTIINANPTFSDFEYEDTNAITLALTGDNQSFIKGYSTLVATVSTTNKATAVKESTISYYQLLDTKENYSSTQDVSITVANYNSSTITVKAVDSRGNSKSATKTITDNGRFIDYQEITKGRMTLVRSNNGVGEYVTLDYDGTFWNDTFGTVTNTLTAVYRYKLTSSDTWTTGTTTINPTITDNNFSFSGIIAGDTENNGFDIDDTYNIEVIVTDELNTVTFSGIIGAGSPAIAIYKNKVSLGDKYDTSLGGIQLWGDIYVNGNRIS